MKLLITPILLAMTAVPAFASSGPFFSLNNTNFVVTVAFIFFVSILLYLKVPGLVAGILDKRSDGIKSEIDEARALRDEAQAILVSYERKQKEVQELAEKIVTTAKDEAKLAAKNAKADLKDAIVRRLQAAEDQIESAQASAIKEVRDTAILVATAVAGDIIAANMSTKDAGSLIDASIKDVGAKLN
jgi:F-type H+-transporting ATPase subunit b